MIFFKSLNNSPDFPTLEKERAMTFFKSFFLKVSFAFILLSALSCVDTIPQYSPEPERYPDMRDIVNDTVSSYLETEPTHPSAGFQYFGGRGALSIAKKEEERRKCSQMPIDYESRSFGCINMYMEEEEANHILSASARSHSPEIAFTIYREGLGVLWRKEYPRIPENVVIFESYQGTINLGERYGEVNLGDYFEEEFDIEKSNVSEDEKARAFIKSLYRSLENSEEDCLETENCHLLYDKRTITFLLPKMWFEFRNDERRRLFRIQMVNFAAAFRQSCFGRKTFDLRGPKFLCEREEDGGTWKTIGLGEKYGSFIAKFEEPFVRINGRDNKNLYVSTINGLKLISQIGWRRDSLEEEPESIPENSPLSTLFFGEYYMFPFLFSESLIKIRIMEKEQVHISLAPLEGEDWTEENLVEKASAESESEFYFSNRMFHNRLSSFKPDLQIKIMEELFNFLESSASSGDSTLKFKREFYKAPDSITGEWIKMSEGRDSLVFQIVIDQEDGDMQTSFKLISGFEKYVIQNRKPVKLNPRAESVSGLRLGAKIYLRNKDIGRNKTITAYLNEKDQAFVFLSDYFPRKVSAALYENNDNLMYRETEALITNDMVLEISPQFQTREIEGEKYEEYEINGIALNESSLYFNTVSNLCSLEDVPDPANNSAFIGSPPLSIGMRGGKFLKSLREKIGQAHRPGAAEFFKGCPYISDNVSSSSDENFYFSRHKLNLTFTADKLSGIRFYKRPSQVKKKGF